MPKGLRRVLMLMIVVVFFSAFYLFFIRPYAFRWHLLSHKELYSDNLPRGYNVCGLDVSHYQGKIKWDKVAKYQTLSVPLSFIFVKATEGADMIDESFQTNFNKARQFGFIRGAYHYYNPLEDPVEQADFFIKKVKLEKGDLPPVLDVEKTGHLVLAIFQRDVKKWIKRVESYYGVKPILYTSYKFKLDYLNDKFFDKYPYWIAHYYVPTLSYSGKWSFWQFTDVGYVPGIKADVDLNVFNGSLVELDTMTIK